MQLTKRDRTALEFYTASNERGFQTGRLLRGYVVIWVGIFALVALGVYLLWNSEVPVGPALLVGILIGGVARDLGYVSRMKKGWPLTREIIDWPKVDHLLAEATASRR